MLLSHHRHDVELAHRLRNVDLAVVTPEEIRKKMTFKANLCARGNARGNFTAGCAARKEK